MVHLQLFLAVIFVIGASGINQRISQVPKNETRITAATRQRTAQFDPNVIRTLKDIEYEERKAAPGTMFSLATLEIENCAEICQDGHYLTGSCGQACRDFYALERANAKIHDLEQSAIQKNREYSKGMNIVIAVFASVIVFLCGLVVVAFVRYHKNVCEHYQRLSEEITRTNLDTQTTMRKEFEDMLAQQRIHTIAASDHTVIPIPEQVQHADNNGEERQGLLNEQPSR